MKDQKGFSIAEGFLLLVIVGILGGIGWYVWDSNKKANESLKSASDANLVTPSASKKEELKPQDETASWLLFEPPGKEYKIRLADGWNLTYKGDPTSLNTIAGDIKYEPGVKATVSERSGDRGGPFELEVFYNSEVAEESIRGSKVGEIKTASSLAGDKYEFVATEDEGHGLSKGEKEYSYFFKKGSSTVWIRHWQPRGQESKTETVEKVVKTLEIN